MCSLLPCVYINAKRSALALLYILESQVRPYDAVRVMLCYMHNGLYVQRSEIAHRGDLMVLYVQCCITCITDCTSSALRSRFHTFSKRRGGSMVLSCCVMLCIMD